MTRQCFPQSTAEAVVFYSCPGEFSQHCTLTIFMLKHFYMPSGQAQYPAMFFHGAKLWHERTPLHRAATHPSC